MSWQSEFRRSSAANVNRDSRGCAGAVRVQSAVSAGAGAPCVRIPVTYAYSPPPCRKRRDGLPATLAGANAGLGVAWPYRRSRWLDFGGARQHVGAVRCRPPARLRADAWSCSKNLAQHCSSSMSWSQCNSCSWRSGHSGGRAVPHDGRAGSSDTSYGPFRVNI